MSFSWRLSGTGWADCTVADKNSQAVATASYLTAAPEELLTAVTRLVAGETDTFAQFEAEPTAYRWRFRRDNGDRVRIQLLHLPDGRSHDEAGAEIWSSWQTTGTVARAVIRAFDEVAHTHGESGYEDKWRSPFPRDELENLRQAWRHARQPAP
jgi:hypothetical protein